MSLSNAVKANAHTHTHTHMYAYIHSRVCTLPMYTSVTKGKPTKRGMPIDTERRTPAPPTASKTNAQQ